MVEWLRDIQERERVGYSLLAIWGITFIIMIILFIIMEILRQV